MGVSKGRSSRGKVSRGWMAVYLTTPTPKPGTRYTKSEAGIPELKPGPGTRVPGTRNPEPEIQNPKPKGRNWKYET